MMETQRPHRSGSSSSELFICFTARPSLSSSSMKISSKSIHSPARSDKLRESTLSLSSSLSRRLRSNGSMKGGQASPMFPTGNKKRGSFENPEPSSPKVTCIGQVRVKKKKQGKNMRTRSTRRGEASFRDGIQQQQQQQNQECLPHRNQRWVHIPLSICETLRSFGSEFNCFLPCRSPCSSANEREKEEKEEEKTRTNTTSSNSCDAVFARWLMAIQEGHEEKGTEIALMVGEEETREKTEAVEGNVMEIDEKGGVNQEIEDEEGGRVSICIPPRNALLLMRCRSEPFRVSALSNRFWDSPATKENEHADEDDEEDSEDDEGQMAEAEQEVVEEDDDNDDEEENVEEVQIECDEKHEEEEMANVALGEPLNLQENVEDSEMQGNPETITTTEVVKSEENPGIGVEDAYERESQHDDSQMEHTDEQIMENGSSAEALVVEVEKSEIEANEAEQETIWPDPVAEKEEAETEEEGRRTSSVSSSSSASAMPVETTRVEREGEEPEQEIAELAEAAQVDLEERMEESKEEKEPGDRAQEMNETAIETEETQEEMRAVEPSQNQEQQKQDQTHDDQSKEGQVEKEKEKSEDRESSSKLPDCLLLMMFEPKLSMEVSKETWVSSTDFIRCRPEKPPAIAKKGGDETAKNVSTDPNPTQQQKQLQQQQPQQQQLQQQQQQQQAARKSFSNLPPAAVAEPPSTAVPQSMAAMIEQKLVNAKAYEPFVLTRCKSEPVRSSVKLAPEACFWKDRRLEPHRPTGQAGLGF